MIFNTGDQTRIDNSLKFLDWFVNEQMEEEENADKMISRYKLFGSDPKGLYALDQDNMQSEPLCSKKRKSAWRMARR